MLITNFQNNFRTMRQQMNKKLRQMMKYSIVALMSIIDSLRGPLRGLQYFIILLESDWALIININMMKNYSMTGEHDFNFLHLLGSGSFGDVYLAEKKQNRELVAIKVINKQKIYSKKYQDLVQVERVILTQTHHQFIVKMSQAFQNQNMVFFVLEYCPGGELFQQKVKKNRLSEDQCRFYCAQIILALQHLHTKGITYRDLKPQNVLIDQFGYIKLIDFGLSNFQTENTIITRGTVQYLAPEVVLRKSSNKAVDWWCLGNLIYELVTGIPAFAGGSKIQIKQKIQKQEPTFPVYVPNKLRSLIRGLMSKNPEDRLGSKGVQQIKLHPWFQKIDWSAIECRSVEAPYHPVAQAVCCSKDLSSSYISCQQLSIFNLRGQCYPSVSEQCFKNFPFSKILGKTSIQTCQDSDSTPKPKANQFYSFSSQSITPKQF